MEEKIEKATLKSIGEIAYDAYGKTTEYKNFMGNPMPKWEDLPEIIKQAWYNAAATIMIMCGK